MLCRNMTTFQLRSLEFTLFFSPHDVLVLFYTFITLPLLLSAPRYWDDVAPSLFTHVLVVLIVFGLRFQKVRHPAVLIFLDLYALIMMQRFYAQAGLINQVLHGNHTMDQQIQNAEEYLFHCQPSIDMAAHFHSLILGEYLHWCYFALFVIVIAYTALLWRTSREAFLLTTGTLLCSYIVCFLLWFMCPVRGPYWEFGPIDPDKVGYFMPHVIHMLIDKGSAVGTATPSSHCLISTVVWVLSFRVNKTVFALLALVIPGLWVSTVYGGFHYALDSLLGTVLGVVLASSAWWLCRRLLDMAVKYAEGPVWSLTSDPGFEDAFLSSVEIVDRSWRRDENL
eukprot:Rmarinus@m.8226